MSYTPSCAKMLVVTNSPLSRVLRITDDTHLYVFSWETRLERDTEYHEEKHVTWETRPHFASICLLWNLVVIFLLCLLTFSSLSPDNPFGVKTLTQVYFSWNSMHKLRSRDRLLLLTMDRVLRQMRQANEWRSLTWRIEKICTRGSRCFRDLFPLHQDVWVGVHERQQDEWQQVMDIPMQSVWEEREGLLFSICQQSMG